jgi:hypothetical protein
MSAVSIPQYLANPCCFVTDLSGFDFTGMFEAVGLAIGLGKDLGLSV